MTKKISLWLVATLVFFLSACSTVPGLSIVSDLSDLKTISDRGFDNMSVDELRLMADKELPASKGMGYDLGLIRRSLAQFVQVDTDGLRKTKDLAGLHASNEGIVIQIMSSLAQLEAVTLRHRTSMADYEDIERRLVSVSKKTNKPVTGNETALNAMVSYMQTAMNMTDEPLAERIISQHLNPVKNNPNLSMETRLRLKYELVLQKAQSQELRGDTAAAYETLIESLNSFELDLGNVKPQTRTLFDNQRNLMRSKAGIAALGLGRPSLALAQLQALKRAVPVQGKRLALDSAVADLEAAWMEYRQDYAGASAVKTRVWESYPVQFRQGSPALGYTTYMAGMMTAMGKWKEADQMLETIPQAGGTARGIQRDLFIGLRTMTRAMLVRPDNGFAEFTAMEGGYESRKGSDPSLYYFSGKTIVFYRRWLSSRSPSDLVEAVRGGREMGRNLRLLQAGGAGRATFLPDSILQLAKESYLAAASEAIGKSGVSQDDLLDALQLLQISDTDRDIAAVASRSRNIPGVSAAQLRELQDLQQSVRATQQQLTSLTLVPDADPAKIQRIAAVANDAAAPLDRLLKSLRSSAPQLQQAFGGLDPLTLRELQARLPAGEALAMFAPLSQSESTFAMIVTRNGVEHRMLPVGSKMVSELVFRIRASVTFDAQVKVPEFDTASARDLHEKLLGWHTQRGRSVNTMTVVANGALGAIPFGLLVQSGQSAIPANDYRRLPWLIRSVAITHSPSIGAWYALTGPQRGGSASGFLAWADPDYTGKSGDSAATLRSVRSALPSVGGDGGSLDANSLSNLGNLLPRLPETKDEADAIAKALGGTTQRDVLVGSAATRSSVLARSASGDLLKRNVLMFATHGLAPAQIPGLETAALAMASEGGSPNPSLLVVSDVLGLQINADWVILSACNTASADRVGGDSLSGLARGFFFAGARAMLVTHWEVESESAAAITTKTIRNYVRNTRTGRAQALQQTSLELIDGKGTPGEWAHPAFWAPYALVGNGGRGVVSR